MSDSIDQPENTSEPAEAPQAAAATPPPADPVSNRHMWLLIFLVLGLVGGGIGWVIKGSFDAARNATEAGQLATSSQFMGIPFETATFTADERLADGGPMMSTSPDPVQVAKDLAAEKERKAKAAAPRRNRYTIYYLVLGILLAGPMGLAEGVRRGQPQGIIIGAAAGIVLGAASGYLAGLLLARTNVALMTTSLEDTYRLMIVHLVAWSILASGVAASTGVISLNIKTILGNAASGLAAAIIASLLYVPVAQAVFIDETFDFPISEVDPNCVMFLYLLGSGAITMFVGHSNLAAAAKSTQA